MKLTCIPMDILRVLLFIYLLQFAGSVFEVPLTGLRLPLENQGFLLIYIPTLYQCLELCVAYKLCLTIRYRKSTGRCILNSDENQRQSVWGIDSRDTPMEKTNIPQGIGGRCAGHTCAIDEMCIDTGQAYHCVKHGYSTVKCPLRWGHRGDLCFTVTIEEKTFGEAEDHCASTGAELLTFDSEDEYRYHRSWIRFQLLLLTSTTVGPGKIWTGMRYSTPMPSWLSFKPPQTGESNLCMGLVYNRNGTGVSWSTTHIGAMEAVSCDEANGVACQHRAPDHWP